MPTNLELVSSATLIIIGKVEGGTPAPARDAREIEDLEIVVRPLSVIKGQLPAESIHLRDLMLAPDSSAVLSNPYEFQEAHPQAYYGGCIRSMFPLGTTAVFLLTRYGDEWIPAGGPFSRWAEDVVLDDAPWTKLVTLYVQAAAMPDADRRIFLEAGRSKLAAKIDDPVARLMALDIGRQLAGPNKPLID